MRVYLPSTLTLLAGIHAAREIGPAPLTAHAVTPALREWYAGGDLEELEYAAMSAAARASLRLLAADPSVPRRRVVLAVEVPDQAVSWAGNAELGNDDRALVEVSAAVPWGRIASGHVDDPAAVADIAAAAEALPAADAGDDDARFTVDGAEGHELLWYATQELPHLLD
ncbi:hypothetical protein BZB76_1811 [Actinomadura pelletieri DSM 43383]|uniref:Uncharacterized protein n=1 Tax=Actinomadura pelletieri DSM 43383 TaxID=1120940 RepID=A0A495QSH0_9ACTN|nr:hypothetical protein [Actinomadura pelletieri]RKS76456.1 hypothetical protein BZB76_1811 [Actinomadura pelletieri DSM 43383]